MSSDAIYVDQSDYRHIALVGEDRVRFLNGMVTSNIATLEEGGWLRTLMLTHKARVLAMFDVHAFADHLLVSCPQDHYENTFETLDRHIVMDDVELEEREMNMHSVWTTAEDVWSARPILEACPSPSSAEAVKVLRMEAGMPEVGVEVTDANFPFESQLVRYVDYQKGCFTGQEPVARVHARGGGGSKRLLGLIAEGAELLPVGEVVATEEKAKGGEVVSVASSERFGSIALAYVHKSAWEPGSAVKVGDRAAVVASLPFVSG